MTVILSLFPSSWLGWTVDLADLVRIPVTPISHVGIILTGWVRPAREPSDLPTDEQERIKLAITERNLFRTMHAAQLLRATELAEQLRQLTALPESAFGNPQPPLLLAIDVTGINPSDVSGIVELKLTRGAANRIHEGDVAVVGQDIVGRIVRVGVTRIKLRPTTHTETGSIRGAVMPAHPIDDQRNRVFPGVLLRNQADGTMYAEVSATSVLQEGDLVVLDDPMWPASGAGLILGTIEKIARLDEAPLRHAITVVPRVRVRDVSSVVVLGSGEGESP